MASPEKIERHHHKRVTSDLEDLTLLEFEHPDAPKLHVEHEAALKEIGPAEEIGTVPKSTLVILAETDKLNEEVPEEQKAKRGHSLVASLSDFDFTFSKLKVCVSVK